MRRVGYEHSVLVGIRDAAVRRNFYRRHRLSSGEVVYDIEWSLRQAESAGLPALPALADAWPPALEEKGKVGQLLALQYLRGPAFKFWHQAQIEAQVAELRADPARYARPDIELSPTEAVEQVAAHLTSDTYRLTQMLKSTRSLGIAFASMHWTLVRFDAERLATSDHPVVVWPLARGRCVPRANDMGAGVTATLEAFAPLGPSRLLLMTWRHDADTPVVVPGRRGELATAGAFVVANADAQWFHKPSLKPWLAKGPREPLSRTLLDDYDTVEAYTSPRRAQAVELASAESRSPLRNGPVSVVQVSRGNSGNAAARTRAGVDGPGSTLCTPPGAPLREASPRSRLQAYAMVSCAAFALHARSSTGPNAADRRGGCRFATPSIQGWIRCG